MKLKLFSVELRVSYPAVAFFTLALICDKNKTMLICLLCSLFHEAGHIAAMKLSGAKLKSVSLNLGDVAINADSTTLSYNAEVFVTISGVAVNFILSGVSFAVYSVSKDNISFSFGVSNMLIGVFNLLPVRFLDGGQLLMYLLQKRFTPKICDKITDVLTVVFVIPIAIWGIIFLFNSSYNFSLLFAAIYLICTLVSKEYKHVS